METMETLQTLSIPQLKQILTDRYDGNAGEILYGFIEMGLKGERLKAAMIRYIERVPALVENC
jgi:hypothetical protein